MYALSNTVAKSEAKVTKYLSSHPNNEQRKRWVDLLPETADELKLCPMTRNFVLSWSAIWNGGTARSDEFGFGRQSYRWCGTDVGMGAGETKGPYFSA